MVDLQINTKYCYTCLKLDNGRSAYMRMDFSIPGEIPFTRKLKFCIPEMTLENVDHCLMCKQCSIALDSAYLFRSMCLETEIKLQSFKQRKGRSAKNCLQPEDSYLDFSVVNVRSLSSEIEGGGVTVSNEATTAVHESTSHTKSLTEQELIEKCCSTIPELKSLSPQSLQCWVASKKIIPIKHTKKEPSLPKSLKDTFWCSICDRYIRGKHHYQFHIRKHVNLTYTCSSCSLDCKNQKNFNAHKTLCSKRKQRVRRISEVKPKLEEIKQNNVAKIVKKPKIMRVKSNGRIRRGIYNCKLCSFVTQNRSLVRKHREEHVGTPPYRCNYCSKIFKDSIKFIRHINEVKHIKSGKKKATKVSVPVKKKAAKVRVPIKKVVKKSVKRVVGLDIGSPPFECTDCTKVFFEAPKFLRHIREAKHTRELNLKNVPVVPVEVKKEKHICDVCEMDFVSEFELADHRERLHQPIENGNLSNGVMEDIQSKMIEPCNEYYCNICSTRFKRLEFFFNHTCIVESQDPAYSCHLCNAPFIGRISLIEHMEVHFTQANPAPQNDSTDEHSGMLLNDLKI